ncbi:MAG: hypothetical protein HY904_03485 [Deltaproteobacteria bacterium]|nr:hypothetical protein [Deltaproteobacteria bacterium]
MRSAGLVKGWAVALALAAVTVACPRLGPGDRGDPCREHADCADDLVCADDKCGTPWARRWRLTVVGAHISALDPSGGAWDSDDSAPDPYMTVTVDGAEALRTQAKPDTLTPAWNEAVTVFLNNNTTVQIALWDDDFFSLFPAPIAATRDAPVALFELRQGSTTAYAVTGTLPDGGGGGMQTTTTITYQWDLAE